MTQIETPAVVGVILAVIGVLLEGLPELHQRRLVVPPLYQLDSALKGRFGGECTPAQFGAQQNALHNPRVTWPRKPGRPNTGAG